MRKLSRRIPYFLAYWFTLALLLQWTSVVVIADPEDGEPTGPCLLSCRQFRLWFSSRRWMPTV
jgi:hypothetical protein